MNGRKMVVLLLVLAFGSVVETAWQVREHTGPYGLGPFGCRVLRGRFYGPSYSFDATSVTPLPAGGALNVENAFGGVRVRAGEAGHVRVALRTVVYLPTENEARAFASRVRLQSSSSGEQLRVTTNRRDLEDGYIGFETHLELEVPPHTRISVGNDHGDVEVTDAAQVEASTNHGALRVTNVAGPATLTGGHGDIEAASVAGALTVHSRHGEVTLRDTGGAVTLDSEHGDVAVHGAAGLTASIKYGDLTTDDLRGGLEVRGEHAGVSAERVEGDLHVETSFQDVRVERVGGGARLAVEHGELKASDVKGPLTASVSFNEVSLTSIGGPVEVKVSHGGVHAEDLRKGGQIEAVGDEVVVERFSGPLRVETQRGGIQLVPAGALVDSVSATAVGGGIRLEVPPGSRFELTALARRGEVQVELPDFAVAETTRERVRGTLGGGGKSVLLSAERGDISLSPATGVASRSE
jgi:DUF4097 and DUF4098 domain-containing protein YvlB